MSTPDALMVKLPTPPARLTNVPAALVPASPARLPPPKVMVAGGTPGVSLIVIELDKVVFCNVCNESLTATGIEAATIVRLCVAVLTPLTAVTRQVTGVEVVGVPLMVAVVVPLT